MALTQIIGSGISGTTINSNGILIPKGVILQVNATNTDQAFDHTGGFTKVQWENVEIDTISGWDSSNHRYTPSVGGYYLIGGQIRVALTSVHSLVAIKVLKNGTDDDNRLTSQFQLNSDAFFNGSYPIPSGIMQMNGSSDYMEVFFDADENATLHDTASIKSNFWAMLVHAT
tara:strand:+ start:46 stop:561 length:516 start_codon:yes stop_codon:yes gene_type:complete